MEGCVGGGYPACLTEPESPAGGSRSRSQQVTSALEGEAGLRLPVASSRRFTNRGIVKWHRGVSDSPWAARGGEVSRVPHNFSSPIHPLQET